MKVSVMIKDLNQSKCIELLSSNYIGRLAFLDKAFPNVLPITYFYDDDGNRIISYSAAGHKIEAMRKNNAVAMEVDEIESVNRWKSVLVTGKFEELQGIDAKYYLQRFSQGVSNIIAEKEKKQLPFIGDFSSKISSEGIPIVYCIKELQMTGKYRDQ